MTMGTASTMASMVEALGVALPGNAAIPAVDARRYRQAQLTGRRIVEMVEEEMKLSKILTRAAFENAIRVNAAIGGSTNAVIHLLAIAGRIGVPLDARRLGQARLGAAVPREPAAVGQVPDGGFLLRGRTAGGDARDRARARRQGAHRQRHARSARTSPTRRAGTATSSSRWTNRSRRSAGIAVLRGNLAPDGAVIKPSAASPHLLQASRAARWCSRASRTSTRASTTRISTSTRTAIMVLKGCGPKGYPGHGRGRQHAAAAQTTAPRASPTSCASPMRA